MKPGYEALRRWFRKGRLKEFRFLFASLSIDGLLSAGVFERTGLADANCIARAGLAQRVFVRPQGIVDDPLLVGEYLRLRLRRQPM